MATQFNEKRAVQLADAITKLSGPGGVEKGKKAPGWAHNLLDALWMFFM
jgi:hypothetical protein